MKTLKFKTACLLLTLSLACSKTPDPTPVVVTPVVTTTKIVYSVGYDQLTGGKTVAKLWTNATATSLSDGTANAYARSISIAGTDIYIGGNDGNKPMVWKNGIGTALTDKGFGGQVNAIFAIGTDVYAAGYVILSGLTDNVAALWKNGSLTILDATKKSNAFGLYVSGTDVYVCGYDGSSPNVVATLWKNGIPTNLSDGSKDTYPYAIAVSGTDVYVVGRGSASTAMQAKLWKNGILTNLTDGTVYAEANAVSVTGTDVYVVGTSVWKNGIITGTTGATTLTSIAISNNDLFYGANNNTPVYYKNNVINQLSTSFGAVYGIAVK